MNNLLKTFLLLILFLSILNILKLVNSNLFLDFNIYYHSAREMFLGHNPFVPGRLFFTGYLYPPVSLLIFYPLLLLSPIIAGKIWFLASFVLFCISLALLFKTFLKNESASIKIFLLILIFNYFPLKFTFGMGQLNILSFFLITLGILYFSSRKYLSGAFFGLSLFVKYFPIFIIPFLIIKKEYKVLISISVLTLVLIVMGLFVTSYSSNIYFLKHVFESLITTSKIDYYNQALSGFLLRSFDHNLANEIRLVLEVFSLPLFFLILYRYKAHIYLQISSVIIYTLIFNSFSWQHHFTLLIIPFVAIFSFLRKYNYPKKYYAILFFSYLLTAINLKDPSLLPVLVQSHVFYGTLILLFLTLYLITHTNASIISSNEK